MQGSKAKAGRGLLFMAGVSAGALAAQQAGAQAAPAVPPANIGSQPSAAAPDGTGQDAAPALGTSPTADGIQDIVVTATRRSSTVQSAPINISAVGSEQIEALRVQNLREIVQTVPGVYIPDSGSRNGADIVFRGLNATPLGSGDGNNTGGGTVATYVGEVPLYVDLRLNDIERVEFLAGPQGTLYGAGTLGGAIRYIPKRPQFDTVSGEVRGEVYGYRHSSSASYNVGGTINLPIAPTLAFRASLDRLDDKGFIDQPYVVNQIGVSNPDPDFTDPADVAANTHRERDVNTDRVWSGRAALRWQPVDTLDVNLTYYHQEERTDGRQASARVSDFPVEYGRYENLKRVLEPNRRINKLLSLEVSADLGFATLTSATGRSWFDDFGHRDQTDLLIGLEYSYEAFPTFTAFTTEKNHTDTFSQEARLVSNGSGPFSWIAGVFYRKQEAYGYSKEFTPGFSAFNVNVLETGGVIRPDDLEYYSPYDGRQYELGGYGELSYKITPDWQVTLGGRYYRYTIRSRSATDLPLLYSSIIGDRGPTDIVLDYNRADQKDDGFLYKLNTSYQFAPDVLGYATVSQGFRLGNSNGLTPCTTTGEQQNVCGQPFELAYKPDKTNNYEIGFKTQWFDRRLTVNVAGYYIEWKDPQVSGATVIGLSPITINGGGAESYGGELLVAARPTDRLSLRLTYAYTHPNLTALSPNLISYITGQPSGFQSTQTFADGEAGDRLPGSPHHSGSVYAEYAYPLSDDRTLNFAYTLVGQSNVFTSTGAKGGSYTLPGFTRSNVSLRLADKTGNWSITLYCDNLFDKFSQTGRSGTAAYNQTVTDIDGGTHYVRTFYTYVLPPRQIGLRLLKSF
jgi:iron complex outermembrane recepter protein